MHHCAIIMVRGKISKISFIAALILFLVDTAAAAEKPKLILFLIDGLRWDRYDLNLPNLMTVEENGVKAQWMNGVFLTQSSPSMYSIATGLYPESHGVIHNLYFDPVTKNRTYSYSEALNITEWFDTGVEPIWVTAIQAGLKVGNIMYPGAQKPVKGVLPDKVVPSVPYYWLNYAMRDRIDDTVSWLSDEDFDLVLLYFDEPDETLHNYGIGDPRSISKLEEVDENVGYLFRRLEEAGISGVTDVIMVSDHGHINNELSKKVSLYDYIDPDDVDFIIADYGPIFQLQAVDGKEEEVYQALKTAHPAMYVYKKEEFPERLHYGNHPRNLPIIGFVDPGWHLHTVFNPDNVLASDHGYDNQWMVMKSSFYAQGKTFKKGFLSEPIESVDVYNLMCDILNLTPAPNNGTRARYQNMLSSATSVKPSMLALVVVALKVTLYWL